MRIAFIHVSDFHFRELDQSFSDRAKAIARAARSLFSHGVQTHPFIIVTGDLAFSGASAQYITAKRFLDALIADASELFGIEPIIFIVPGNHDVNHPWDSTEVLEEWIESTKDEKAEAIELELERSSDYYTFVEEYGFRINRRDGSCTKTIELKEGHETLRVRGVMLASSPFSSLGNDLGRHHYLEETIQKLYSEVQSDGVPTYNALLMHHPERFFDDESRQRLGVAIAERIDFLFTGHDHMESSTASIHTNKSLTVASQSGQLSRDDWQRSSFCCVALDSKSHTVETHLFNWDPNEQLYIRCNSSSQQLVYPKGVFRPQQEYLSSIASDTEGVAESLLDYYEFPILRDESPMRRKTAPAEQPCIDEESFYKKLNSAKIINLSGTHNSGKSALLRYLYIRSLDYGFVPLLLNPESATKSFTKSFDSIVIEQYGDTDALKARYQQADYSRKILMIDDYHRLRTRKRPSDYFNEALKQVSAIIVVTEHPLFQEDAAQGARSLASEDSLCYIRIGSFTKSKRDRLVARICAAQGIDECLWDNISIAINRSVARYRTLFPLTPGFIIQYLRYGLRESNPVAILARCAKPFGEVYEGNLQDALATAQYPQSQCIETAQWVLFSMDIISLLAYKMHEQRTASVSYTDAITFLKQYLDNRENSDLTPMSVLGAFIDSRILSQDTSDGSVYFKNSNHFAFFIAKRLDDMISDPQRRYEERWKSGLERLFKEVCYGINETALLFLSYMQSNSFLPVSLCERSNNLLTSIEEAVDFSFAHLLVPPQIPIANDDDRDAANEAIDRAEMEWLESAQGVSVEYRDVYDYDIYEDDQRDPLLVSRACKYMEMAVRSYTLQIRTMEKSDQDKIVSSVFETASKIVGIAANRYGKTFDETVADAYNAIRSSDKGLKIAQQDVAMLYSTLIITLTLATLDSIVGPMADEHSIQRMLRHNPTSMLDRIMELLIRSHQVDPKEFCKYAGEVMRYAERQGCNGDRFAICCTAYIYVINHPHLSSRLKGIIADTVLKDRRGKRSKPHLLRHL